MTDDFYNDVLYDTNMFKKSTANGSIPTKRVLEKLDVHLSRNDYLSAERHLNYWLEEARSVSDISGIFLICNELIGIYRKTVQKEKCIKICENVLSLIDDERILGTASEATALINVATAYKAFGKLGEALPLYEKAKVIYEGTLKSDDARLGGLYNNMAICLMDMDRLSESQALFYKALDVMKSVKNSEGESAITYLNLADLALKKYGMEAAEEEIAELIEKAMQLLNTDTLPRDGNYAFVCEKCAPVFGFYGYFIYEQQLTERAKEIYERT